MNHHSSLITVITDQELKCIVLIYGGVNSVGVGPRNSWGWCTRDECCSVPVWRLKDSESDNRRALPTPDCPSRLTFSGSLDALFLCNGPSRHNANARRISRWRFVSHVWRLTNAYCLLTRSIIVIWALCEPNSLFRCAVTQCAHGFREPPDVLRRRAAIMRRGRFGIPRASH